MFLPDDPVPCSVSDFKSEVDVDSSSFVETTACQVVGSSESNTEKLMQNWRAIRLRTRLRRDKEFGGISP
jgi:hypothetical protein